MATKPYLLTDTEYVDPPWLAYVRFTVNVTVNRKPSGELTESFIGTIGIARNGRITYPMVTLAEPGDALIFAEAMKMAADFARGYCTASAVASTDVTP